MLDDSARKAGGRKLKQFFSDRFFPFGSAAAASAAAASGSSDPFFFGEGALRGPPPCSPMW